jgi:hypothetical protein
MKFMPNLMWLNLIPLDFLCQWPLYHDYFILELEKTYLLEMSLVCKNEPSWKLFLCMHAQKGPLVAHIYFYRVSSMFQ